jgi:competence protein ComEC
VGIHNLSLAAALMLFMNPFQLWDISFQLSFLATLSLLVMADPIIRRISRKRVKPEDQQNGKTPILTELVVSTLCASFAVFPVLFRLTGTLSLVSIPANILVGPLQPPIMVIGGAALLVGFLSPLIGGILAKMIWPLVALCNQIALRFSVHPSSLIYLPDWVFGVSLTAVIGTLAFFSWKQIKQFSIPADENALD